MLTMKSVVVFVVIVVVSQDISAEPRYRCPNKRYIRLANSCYLLSGEIATWQEAHFRCRDLDAQLAVLATEYEDSSLRNYLEKRELAQLGRWIGGMWAQDHWIWAAQGTEIDNRRAFVSSSAQHLSSADQWMCLYMDSRNRYRWANENCIRQLHYICEAPLTRTRIGHLNRTSTVIYATNNNQ
ncbi:unnamed protein product [Allacma fusca]|uniref:C-type lectin domain-containing protein n=1 Tax=Allacma fusca TaxID=39272 RepID=A0A8J2LU15_9HEXA|nr:unnamed protein product [Allacma fusca]